VSVLTPKRSLDYEQSFLNRTNDLFWRVLTGFQIEIRWTDSDNTRRGTTPVAGWIGTKFPRRIGALEIVLEHAVFNNRRL